MVRLRRQQPVVKLEPSENVYTYFAFAVPMEEQKFPGTFGAKKLLAYTLVFGSLVLQAVLLYAIFNSIVYEDIEWRNSILDPRGERFIGHEIHPYAPIDFPCNAGTSLCMKLNGVYTCAPPSVQLTGRWSELDTNGDDVWTREEVMMSRERLQCAYAVDPIEVFEMIIDFLLKREDIIWIHPDVREGRAIFKTYFTYAVGDIIMCSYRNEEFCGNLLKRGVFDAALTFGTAPRVGNTTESALDYCHTLLKEGGVCERLLPSTYAVWKQASDRQCKSTKYSKYVFRHPISNRSRSMIVVDYEARKDYRRAESSMIFLVYKAFVIAIFLLAMLGELKNILILAQWVIQYPCKAESTRTSDESDSDDCELGDDNIIHDISKHHRLTVAFFVVARFTMLVVLSWVGTMFLLKDTDYVNLVLNSLAMIVVAEISQNMYVFFISPELRQECAGMRAMAMPAPGPACLQRRPALKDILILVFFVTVVSGLMYLNHTFIIHPVSSALECACLSEGESCFERQRFSYDFWANYWKTDVPNVFREIATLKAMEQNQ